VSNGVHPAAFPIELPRRIISAWCPPNGVVLDPFGGGGTVALAAQSLGRQYVSIDISDEYTELARQRLTNNGA
jgi:site-specific DNA-methyltransferase (cytosine-N4-specific)